MALTGSFGIGDVEFSLQPTAGRWLPQTPVGITGDGHPIYPQVRAFQLSWGLMGISEFDNIRDYYKQTQITGSVVVALPDIDASTWTFRNYSGCVLGEPEVGQYFSQWVTDVNMMVWNITL